MTVWYPQWSLSVTTPTPDGGLFRWDMPVSWFRWERNDYATADVLEVKASWPSAGLDPRMLANACGEFSLRNGAPNQLATWGSTPARDDLRFAGIMQKPSRKWSKDSREVSLLFHDYTTLFLCEKPFISKGIPDHGQKLSEAWARICDHVGPTDPDDGNKTKSVIGEHLRNNIVFLGGATDAPIGQAVDGRFQKDQIGASGATDAWAVWQQCIQMTGLISYIEVDHLVITTATDYFTSKNPGRLIMGLNIEELEEERDLPRSRSGIILSSFNPLDGTVLEVFSPKLGDSSVRKHHVKSSKKRAPTEEQIIKGESRERFNCPPPAITNEKVLQAFADRIQAERSVQELAGHVTTGAMVIPSMGTATPIQTWGKDVGAGTQIDTDGDPYDLLTLSAGDVISIEVEQELMQAILDMHPTFGTVDERVPWLVAHGYNEGAAQVLVANIADYAALGTKFFVKSVVTEADASGNPPSYKTEIHYCNRIRASGDAVASLDK